jgi:hypothetical protein
MTALAEKTGLSREMSYRTLSEIRRAEKLLSEDEHDGLIAFLASDPEAGDEIVGTGGVRKVRYGAKGKGKSGGVRRRWLPWPDEPWKQVARSTISR